MNILLITGGNSSERSVSLISAKEVKKALEANKQNVKIFDIKHGTKEMIKLIKNCDLVFPVIHGEEGEGGDLQKILLNRGKPFVGGHHLGFKKGWYKIPFKKFCDKEKILTAPWKIVKRESDVIKFGFPCVLKGSSGGSSKEVVILNSFEQLKTKPSQGLIHSTEPVFAERFLKGVEVTVGILGDNTLPVMEIMPPQGEWFDFKNKYSGKTQELPHAPSLDKKTRENIQNIALQMHKSLNLGHYSRIDFIVSENLANALEINTIPGLTPTSLFPKAAQAAGINFVELTQKLVDLALKHPISL